MRIFSSVDPRIDYHEDECVLGRSNLDSLKRRRHFSLLDADLPSEMEENLCRDIPSALRGRVVKNYHHVMMELFEDIFDTTFERRIRDIFGAIVTWKFGDNYDEVNPAYLLRLRGNRKNAVVNSAYGQILHPLFVGRKDLEFHFVKERCGIYDMKFRMTWAPKWLPLVSVGIQVNPYASNDSDVITMNYRRPSIHQVIQDAINKKIHGYQFTNREAHLIDSDAAVHYSLMLYFAIMHIQSILEFSIMQNTESNVGLFSTISRRVLQGNLVLTDFLIDWARDSIVSPMDRSQFAGLPDHHIKYIENSNYPDYLDQLNHPAVNQYMPSVNRQVNTEPTVSTKDQYGLKINRKEPRDQTTPAVRHIWMDKLKQEQCTNIQGFGLNDKHTLRYPFRDPSVFTEFDFMLSTPREPIFMRHGIDEFPVYNANGFRLTWGLSMASPACLAKLFIPEKVENRYKSSIHKRNCDCAHHHTLCRCLTEKNQETHVV